MFRRALLTARTAAPRAIVAPRQLAIPALRTARCAYSTDAPKSEEPLKKEEEELKEITKETEKLQKELDAAKKEAADYKVTLPPCSPLPLPLCRPAHTCPQDKFTRAVAEFRNFQERSERDKRAAREFAIQKFAKDLVDSVDNLDRALQAVPEGARTDTENNKELVDLYNGLKMTEEILLNTMKKHGLEKINPMGEQFDPNAHEATFMVQMPDKEPGSVFHVQQTGFTLNGRTIRVSFPDDWEDGGKGSDDVC